MKEGQPRPQIWGFAIEQGKKLGLSEKDLKDIITICEDRGLKGIDVQLQYHVKDVLDWALQNLDQLPPAHDKEGLKNKLAHEVLRNLGVQST